jgi:hypothetical protein
LLGAEPTEIFIRGNVKTHTHYIWTEEMRKKRMHIYNHMRGGFGKRNEYERRDDMRSKTISSGRKEGLTSREEKGETKEKEIDRGACNQYIGYNVK